MKMLDMSVTGSSTVLFIFLFIFVNFSSLGVFKRSIQLVNFSEYLKCY